MVFCLRYQAIYKIVIFGSDLKNEKLKTSWLFSLISMI